MNKITKVIIAIIALLIVYAGITLSRKGNEQQGEKQIAIQITVDKKEIYNDVVYTDTTTLGDLLIEMKDQGKLDFEYEISAFGMYIKSIEGYEEKPSQGKYWVFESENNTMCKASGYCDAADVTNISDGDIFLFKLEVYE